MSDTLLVDIRAALIGAAAVTSVVAQRIYPDAAPESASLPYIVYSDISLVADQDLQGTNGNRTARIQFDIYSTNKSEAHDLREALLAELNGYRGPLNNSTPVLHSDLGNSRSGFDAAERVYSYSVDILFDYTI